MSALPIVIGAVIALAAGPALAGGGGCGFGHTKSVQADQQTSTPVDTASTTKTEPKG
jgi:hypothetical protein